MVRVYRYLLAITARIKEILLEKCLRFSITDSL